MAIDHAAPAERRYDVFISYSRKDRSFARRLEHELRTYRPPRDLGVPQRFLRIFRDEEDFTGAEYHDALDRALADSAKLLVICSPNAAGSERVAEEIVRFSRFRGRQHIVPILLDGIPNSEAVHDEAARRAFPDALVDLLPIPLASDYRGFDAGADRIRRGKFAAAWFKVIADVYADYGVDRGGLEQRERRRVLRRLRNVAIGSSAIASALIGLTVWALISRSQAVTQQQIATRERGRADEQTRIATSERDTARQQSQIALSRQLAANSAYLLTKDVELSLLVGLEATTTYDTLEARKALFAGVTRVAGVDKLLRFTAGPIVHAAFRPGGGPGLHALVREPVPGTNTSSLRLWDLTTAKPIWAPATSRERERNFPASTPIAVSTNGRYLAAGTCEVISEGPERPDRQNRAYCTEGRIDIYAINVSGLIKDKSLAYRGWIEAIALNSDASMLAVKSCQRANATLGNTCEESAFNLLDAASGKSVPSKRPSDVPYLFAVSPLGTVAAVSNTSIQVISKSGDTYPLPERPYRRSITSLAFGAEQLLAAGTFDGRIFLIDLKNDYNVDHLLTGHGSAVASLSFSSDGERLLSAGTDGTILVHRGSVNHLARMLGRHGQPVSSVAFSPDGRVVISGAPDRRINFWDVSPGSNRNGKPVAVISDGIQEFVECVAFAPDGTMIAANTRSVYVGTNLLQIWNAKTRKPIGSAIRVSGRGCNAFRPRRDQIAASWNEAISLFDVKTARPVGSPLPCCSSEFDGLMFSADGQSLFSAGDSGKAVSWNLTENRPRSIVLADRKRGVSSVALNVRGALLALAGSGWAEIVDLTNGDATAIDVGIPGKVVGMAFHPTDELLVLGSEDGIHVWDLRRWEAIEPPLQIQGRALRSLAVSPDGRTIAAGYSDGAVMLWNLGIAEWRSMACRVVSRAMSAKEWRRYLEETPYRETCAQAR